METLMVVTLVVLALMLIILGAAVVVLLLRRPSSEGLGQLPQAMGAVQGELRGLVERIGAVERSQEQLQQNLMALGSGVAQTGSVAQSLQQTALAIRQELSRAKEDLTGLQERARARQELEQRTAASIARLEAVIAGTQTKGSAGENILEVVFAKLPPEWQVRNFRVGDKAVEFGLRLPNNLVLPIDSKWAATRLLEQFASAGEPEEQQRLKAQIESAVMGRAREIRKYIDPNITVNFGVAAVPDAVYELCSGIQADLFRMNVVLISYSMFVPYLLLVFQTILKSGQSVDLQRLEAHLHGMQRSIEALQDELEGRFSKALTMLSNARADMGVHLSKIQSGLTSLELRAAGANRETALGPPSDGGESLPALDNGHA